MISDDDLSPDESLEEVVVQQSSRNLRIEKPRVGEEEAPRFAAVWGTFQGIDEKLAGAFYCELPHDGYEFRELVLSLFTHSEDLERFELTAPPVSFKSDVIERTGPHGDLKKSDVNMIHNTFENFLLDHSQKDEFFRWLENSEKKELTDFFDRLIASIVRKGKLKFDISTMIFSPGQLGPAKNKKTDVDSEEQEKNGPSTVGGLEDSRNYSRAKIVTIPLKGVSPKELQPGDEIFVRALGELADRYPDDMQSDKFDNSTVPLEAEVKSVSLSPRLPADHDGDPEDYIEIKAQLGEGDYVRGYVFKDETVKTVGELERNKGSDIIFIVGLFFAAGFALLIISAAAWLIFG